MTETMFKINIMPRSCFIAIPVIFLGGLMLTSPGIVARQDKAGPFTRLDTRLQWQNEGELYWIEAFGPDALRFRSSKSLRIVDENWTLLPQPLFQPEITINEERAVIKNGRIRAEIEAKDGRVTYLNEKGEVLLKEAYHKHHAHFARQFKSRGSDHFELKLTFDADKDEHLYGMGQYPNDCLDLKGTVLELAQKNTQISIPFLLSSKGYGFDLPPSQGSSPCVRINLDWNVHSRAGTMLGGRSVLLQE